MDAPPPDPERPASHRPLFAMLGLVVVLAVAVGLVALATALEQAAHPPTCYGIGWGCTPDPAATALIVGAVVGVPVFLGATALTWIGWAVTRTRSHRINRIATWWPVWLLAAGDLALLVLAGSAGG